MCYCDAPYEIHDVHCEIYGLQNEKLLRGIFEFWYCQLDLIFKNLSKMPRRLALIYQKTYSSTESNSIKQSGSSVCWNECHAFQHFAMQTKSVFLIALCLSIFFNPSNSFIFFAEIVLLLACYNFRFSWLNSISIIINRP